MHVNHLYSVCSDSLSSLKAFLSSTTKLLYKRKQYTQWFKFSKLKKPLIFALLYFKEHSFLTITIHSKTYVAKSFRSSTEYLFIYAHIFLLSAKKAVTKCQKKVIEIWNSWKFARKRTMMREAKKNPEFPVSQLHNLIYSFCFCTWTSPSITGTTIGIKYYGHIEPKFYF